MKSPTSYVREWMKDASVTKVMEVLNPNGERRSLFVGGTVRDHLLGLSVKDIDIATQFTPDEVAALCEDAGIKTYATGIAHGTITAVTENKKSFEITSLRRDVETDGRRAVVSFTQDWREDAQRRDFTLNALYMDKEGAVFDPLGCGYGDLRAGNVRFVGSARDRIREDYLRILRYFRFQGIFGQEPSAEALSACIAEKDGLEKLSKERVFDEISKCLRHEKALKIMSLFSKTDVLSFLFGGLEGKLSILAAIIEGQKKYECFDLMARWAALGDAEKTPSFILKKSAYADFEFYQNAQNEFNKIDEMYLFNLLFKNNKSRSLNALLLAKAKGEHLDHVAAMDRPVFPLAGQDLIALGFEEGRALGEVLQSLEDLWIKSCGRLDKEALQQQAVQFK